jgi:hypothetical protein
MPNFCIASEDSHSVSAQKRSFQHKRWADIILLIGVSKHNIRRNIAALHFSIGNCQYYPLPSTPRRPIAIARADFRNRTRCVAEGHAEAST